MRKIWNIIPLFNWERSEILFHLSIEKDLKYYSINQLKRKKKVRKRMNVLFTMQCKKNVWEKMFDLFERQYKMCYKKHFSSMLKSVHKI